MRTRQEILDYLKEYRIQNAEQISLQKSLWYKEHIDQERAKRRTHYMKNKLAYIQRASSWSRANPEKAKRAKNKWRVNNQEVMNMHGSNYRAKKRGTISEKYNRLEVYERDNGTCGICKKHIFKIYKHPDVRSFSIDHIYPISLGGQDVLGNIQAAHFGCNSAKRNRYETN
jgi:5-methylcytosine-specific restriction endonuclease McrA